VIGDTTTSLSYQISGQVDVDRLLDPSSVNPPQPNLLGIANRATSNPHDADHRVNDPPVGLA